MTNRITVTGLVATTPRRLMTSEGIPITSFRLADQTRRTEGGPGRPAVDSLNWYTVTALRDLGVNAADSLTKGDRVIVTGVLRLREWESSLQRGLNVELEADVIGYDLGWGAGKFERRIPAVGPTEGTTS